MLSYFVVGDLPWAWVCDKVLLEMWMARMKDLSDHRYDVRPDPREAGAGAL
jgi:hypothetical protein